MKRFLVALIALLPVLFAACAPQSTAETAQQLSGGGPVVTVYHPPT